jgi:hypothetical protein
MEKQEKPTFEEFFAKERILKLNDIRNGHFCPVCGSLKMETVNNLPNCRDCPD